MRDNEQIQSLLRSIRSALWMIVAILLMQIGFHLVDFRRTPFAEIIMLLSFWGGFFVLLCSLIGALVRLFTPANNKEAQAEQDGRGQPATRSESK